MVWTHWIPRPRWALLHGLSHESLSAARAEALRTLDDSPEVDHVELTDGKTTIYEVVRREDRFARCDELLDQMAVDYPDSAERENMKGKST